MLLKNKQFRRLLMSALLGVAAALCSSVPCVAAQAEDAQAPEYRLSDDGTTFEKYFGSGISFTVPEGVKTIKVDAFENCSSLESVVLPESLESIQDHAFTGCSSLKSIRIPKNVHNVGSSAFKQSGVASIDVAEGNSHYRSIDGVLFSIDGKTLVKCPDGLASDVYIVPYGVKTIDPFAFSYCSQINAIVVSYGVTTIRTGAFFSASNLKTVVLPEKLESIKKSAFDDCFSLTSVCVADKNEVYRSIDGVLFSKDGTKLVYFPQGRDDERFVVPDGVVTIEERAFYNHPRLKTIVLSGDVKEIDDSAFLLCDALTAFEVDERQTNYKVVDGVLFSADGTVLVKYPQAKEQENYVVPDGVKEIGVAAFAPSRALKTIELPDGVEKIGNGAFMTRGELTTVVVPKSAHIFAGECFSRRDSMTVRGYKGSYVEQYADGRAFTFEPIDESTDEPSSAYELSEDGLAFVKYVDKGEKLTVPNGVKKIGGNAFDDCSSLKTINVPKSVEEIESFAFSNCPSLTAINVAEDNPVYRSIDGVLYSKDGKTLVAVPAGKVKDAFAVPDGVETIGSCAFGACSSLTGVELPKSVRRIRVGAFYGCSSLKKCVVPDGVREIPAAAFFSCAALEDVVVPASVEEIDGSAFYPTDKLTISAPKGSRAERFAMRKKIDFKPID